jgi:hypothetical protein
MRLLLLAVPARYTIGRSRGAVEVLSVLVLPCNLLRVVGLCAVWLLLSPLSILFHRSGNRAVEVLRVLIFPCSLTLAVGVTLRLSRLCLHTSDGSDYSERFCHDTNGWTLHG